MKNLRTSERYDDFARVECSGLCVVPGFLLDISLDGLKVEFNAPCEVDNEKEYEIVLRLSRFSAAPLSLTVRPAWSDFENGKTSIGFTVLHSKDSSRLEKYLGYLKEDQTSESDIKIPADDTSSLFI